MEVKAEQTPENCTYGCDGQTSVVECPEHGLRAFMTDIKKQAEEDGWVDGWQDIIDSFMKTLNGEQLKRTGPKVSQCLLSHTDEWHHVVEKARVMKEESVKMLMSLDTQLDSQTAIEHDVIELSSALRVLGFLFGSEL